MVLWRTIWKRRFLLTQTGGTSDMDQHMEPLLTQTFPSYHSLQHNTQHITLLSSQITKEVTSIDTQMKYITRKKTYMNTLRDSDGIRDMSMSGTKSQKVADYPQINKSKDIQNISKYRTSIGSTTKIRVYQ